MKHAVPEVRVARRWRYVTLVILMGVSACTEDGVDPSDFDAAWPTLDVAAPDSTNDSTSSESGTSGRPDGGAVPDIVVAGDVSNTSDVGNGSDIGNPPVDDGGGTSRDVGVVPPLDPECDLRGRWLVSQRYVAEAVSEKQGSHSWFYLEVRHEGANVTVQRGLHCGYNVTPISPLGGKVDCSASWPAFLAKNSSTGRRGTFVKNGSACRLKFDAEYTPRGVSLPFYLDPVRPLPTASQKAQGTTPGWEDWDGDGNPGVTLNVSGLATGKIFSAQRERTVYEGDVPLGATKFKVPISVGFENTVLGRDGPVLLESPSNVSADPSLHYAWFARFADDQALGSDAEACIAVRTLKAKLVPEGEM